MSAVASRRSFFTELKSGPAAPGLESLLTAVNKLQRVRKLDERGKLVTIDLDSCEPSRAEVSHERGS